MSHEITRERERELLRLLAGEASPEEARALSAAMDREPELARRYARLLETWEGLQLPEPEPAPPGFSHRVVARLPEEPGGVLGLAGAPTWARAAAALALAVGLGAGVFLGQGLEPDPAVEEIALVETGAGLAEAYRSALYGDGDVFEDAAGETP